MAHAAARTLDREVLHLPQASLDLSTRYTLAGAAGVAIAIVFGVINGWDVFFRSYILNYCYVLSLALGALFFVMLQHLTRAGWSVSLRRLAECIMGTLPMLAVLFAPVLIPVVTHSGGVYLWADPKVVAGDPLLAHKQSWLNLPAFVLRCALYFGVWALLARYMLRRSVEQDRTGDPQTTLALDRASAGGMLLFAITLTFFAIDVLMSLNPHFFSTIWGVYYFAGSAVGFFALLGVTAMLVQRAGALKTAISVEHYHDIGKLAFAFTVFWAYIGFSQYMLIWYANVPEETLFFAARQRDWWWIGVSLFLLFGHFVFPFLALISRVPKRSRTLLFAGCCWLLFMHWVDIYWLVTPRPFGYEVPGLAPLHVSDFALLLGLGGLFVGQIIRTMRGVALAPVRDPRLHEALAFENI